ncbi:hypothetical protein [Christiangramia fulva]|nr:hypothetical protein [Christiangramia fulva]
MRTLIRNFYQMLIGKCDDFAQSCTQDEIVITLVLMVVFIGSGILAIYFI